MPSKKDIIAMTDTATPMAAFSSVVTADEVFSAVKLIVGL